MADCDYCEESFDGEVPDSHLRSAHLDELGPIDRRRLGEPDEDEGLPTGPIALVAVIGLAAALVAYVVFFAGNGSASGVGAAGSAHYHGSMQVTVLGDQVDFSQQQYQLQDRRFHFEGGTGTEWHAHATDVTLGYAMEALGFDVTRDSFTHQGTTYEDGSEYDVTVAVDGNSVGPGYVLQEGDSVAVVVEQA